MISQSSRALFSESAEWKREVASFHAAYAHTGLDERPAMPGALGRCSGEREMLRGAAPENIIESPPMMPTVPLDLAQAELEMVLDSPSFRGSPKLSGFLRYVARHTIDGNDDAIKEYNIGVEVFERGSNFDPRMDNIVRSQAHRLRVSLAAYYAGEGQQDPVRIEIVPGSYVPRFRTPKVVEESRSAAESSNWKRRAAWVLGGALLLAATLWLSRSTSVPPVEPLELAIALPNTLRLDLDAGIGTLAPDSRSIVIPAVDRQSVRRLWLRALDSSALRALPGTEDASFPFWSPKGRQIAFFRNSTTMIFPSGSNSGTAASQEN